MRVQWLRNGCGCGGWLGACLIDIACVRVGALCASVCRGVSVAVKVLHNVADKHMVELVYETELLSLLRHKHIALFMALSSHGGRLAMVLEYVALGSMYGLLHNKGVQWTPAAIVKLAVGTARGVHYLHSQRPPIIHRDLKSLNVLVVRRGSRVVRVSVRAPRCSGRADAKAAW